MISDLGEETYHFPTHIVPTDLRPDLEMWSDLHRRLYIVELTVCFETLFGEAAGRKTVRNTKLASDARANGSQATIIPIQIGSREVIEESGLKDLRNGLKHIPAKE